LENDKPSFRNLLKCILYAFAADVADKENIFNQVHTENFHYIGGTQFILLGYINHHGIPSLCENTIKYASCTFPIMIHMSICTLTWTIT